MIAHLRPEPVIVHPILSATDRKATKYESNLQVDARGPSQFESSFLIRVLVRDNDEQNPHHEEYPDGKEDRNQVRAVQKHDLICYLYKMSNCFNKISASVFPFIVASSIPEFTNRVTSFRSFL
jgi:hypothetical protein